MTCGLCQRSQRDGFRDISCPGIHKVEQCPTGEIFRLMPENKGFWFLFRKMLPGLIDAYGAFKFEAIKYVMNLYNVDPGQRPVIHEKCLAVMAAIREVHEEEREKQTSV